MTSLFTADPETMRKRESIIGRVRGVRKRSETETTLGLIGTESCFNTVTYNAAWVRALLRHKHVEIEWFWVAVSNDGRRGKRVDSLDSLIHDHDQGSIEGVCCRVPVKCVTVKGSPRIASGLSAAINTPKDADQAREAFSGGGDS